MENTLTPEVPKETSVLLKRDCQEMRERGKDLSTGRGDWLENIDNPRALRYNTLMDVGHLSARYTGKETEKGIKSGMAETKKNILTYAGLKKYEEELADLKVVKRREIAQKIKEAREQGDLSENAEYDAAKDEQRDIELRIEELEKLLKNAEVVVEDEIELDKISVGCEVKVYDVEYEEEMDFRIVGSTEANSLQNRISNESPVGKALIGKRVGETVVVETQAGDVEYKVLDIKRVS